MKTIKHLFTVLLMLCATTVATAHDFEAGGIYYNILSEENKTVEVTYKGDSYIAYTNEYSGRVVIPESVTYNGTTYSVTSIGSSAFSGCYRLTSIEIPNSVTSIGDYAFDGCWGLTSIEIPNSVTSIGDYAFRGCSGLTRISVESGNTIYDSRNNCNAIIETATNKLMAGCQNTIIPNSVTSIGESAFKGCKGLTSITIPNSVTSIGNEAFNGCTWLKELRIEDGEGTLSLGYNTYYNSYNFSEGLFYDCPLKTLYLGRNLSYNTDRNCGYSPFYKKTLTSVTIGNSVTSIGDNAFYNCYSLTSVEIPNSVTSIGNYAFSDCSGLTSIEIPNSVTSIGDVAFYKCTGLTSITIPNSVTSIGISAFKGCTGLTSITIPNSVTNIGIGAFAGCSGLTSITIPNSVTSIGLSAFSSCTGLTSITIPNCVTSIDDNAFYGCSGLTSIVIPNSVTSIGSSAFYGCSGLTSIEIPSSVTSIGNEAFNGCKGLKTIYNFSNLTFSKGSSYNGYVAYYADDVYNAPNGSIEGDFIFGKPNDVNTLLYYLGNATDLTLPAGYNGENYVIGNDAFNGCTGLTSVTIPNSVTSIGNSAFEGCSDLTSITIPNSVTSIGDNAFNGCTGLKIVYNFSKLTFSKGSYEYGYIAYYADKVYNAPNGSIEGDFIFGKPNDVNTLLYYLGNATELTLPGDYNGENYAIGTDAFYGITTITSVTIPNSVTSIGEWAFSGCTGLTSVEFNAENCTTMGSSSYLVFSGCTALSTVTIGENVKTIPDYAFPGCIGLTSVVIPNSVTSIGEYAFYDCTGLTGIEIPNSVTSIGASAFEGCNNIEKLYIGSSVGSIGDKAFAGCEKITEIKVALGKPIRGSAYIFTNAVYDNATLYIPNGTEQLYQKREPWNLFFYIVEIDFTGIEEVKSESGTNGRRPEGLKAKVKTIYDLNGRAVENPINGIYIIDGKKCWVSESND